MACREAWLPWGRGSPLPPRVVDFAPSLATRTGREIFFRCARMRDRVGGCGSSGSIPAVDAAGMASSNASRRGACATWSAAWSKRRQPLRLRFVSSRSVRVCAKSSTSCNPRWSRPRACSMVATRARRSSSGKRAASLLAGLRRGARLSASHEYAPATVKRAVAGSGRASKQQVQNMVRALCSLEPPRLDASDALAIAICHAFRTCARPACIARAFCPRGRPA